MSTSSSVIEQPPIDLTTQAQQSTAAPEVRDNFESTEPAHELGMWLIALRSYFHARNHPHTDADQTGILVRNWSNEIRIARQALLRSSQLALRLVHTEGEGAKNESADDDELLSGELGFIDIGPRSDASPSTDLLVSLAETLNDLGIICEGLLKAPDVSFYAWATIGKLLGRELDRIEVARTLERSARHHAGARLQASLLGLLNHGKATNAFEADMLIVFTDLARLIEWLRFVEYALRRDQPLKQTLPIFCLVNDETRALLDFIETRALRTDGLNESVFDALDGTNYAITMELRKVFTHELVNLSSLRQAPPIYAKVENSHGLLRDCFQQSTVGLAQLFDNALDGSRLFGTFHTKLEQSLMLRNDLWALFQIVRRAEQERDSQPISLVLDRLAAFRDGSLRYLMFKDWEACERFIEEIAIARGPVEVTPVLHRFGAFLETLHGQVNMRAVLVGHPFEYPPLAV